MLEEKTNATFFIRLIINVSNGIPNSEFLFSFHYTGNKWELPKYAKRKL